MRPLHRFLHRQRERWRYHTAKTDFERKVAEINQNSRQILLDGNFFSVDGFDLTLQGELHGFVLTRFDLFRRLLCSDAGQFSVIDDRLVYRIGGISLNVSTAEELFILYEIFIEHCYQLDVPEPRYLMIDVGMNVGFASLFFAQNPKVDRVFGFEPFKPTFDAALENFRLNPHVAQKIVPSNIGLGNSDQSRRASYSKTLKGKNSIVVRDGMTTEPVIIRDGYGMIRSLVEENSTWNFYIKMDCEGAEFDIFQSFQGQRMPEQVSGIILEWHRRDPQDIVRYLNQNGFRVQKRGGQEIGIVVAFR